MVKDVLPPVKISSRFINTTALKWAYLLLLIPVGLYLVFMVYERELTHFIIPFFPDEPDKSFNFYNDFLWLCFNELLFLTVFFAITLYFFSHALFKKIVHRFEIHVSSRSLFYVIVIIGLSFIITLIISFKALQEFPNSADEYVYVVQAETLSRGKLSYRPHPLSDFFKYNHIAQKEGQRVGRFPPGWPLILSLAFTLNIPPFIINPLLSLSALIFFYLFVKRFYDQRIAFWSLLTLAFSSFFIFNGASFFSHTSTMLFAVGFMYCIHVHDRAAGIMVLIFAGVFLGLMTITRYYTAVLMFAPVMLFLLHRYQWKGMIKVLWIGIGALPSLTFLLWYNYEITGNPFLPVTVWTNSNESLGFVEGHTFMKGVEHLVRRIFMFLYWCSPALLILYFVFLIDKVRKTSRFNYPADYFFILLLIGYFFYYHLGGNQYGPRFTFEAYPFLVLFVVSKVFSSNSKLLLALFFAGLAFSIVKIPYIAKREAQVVFERNDLYRQVRKEKLTRSDIFISSPTGVIRPMPALDLTRNPLDYSSDVIYALDWGKKNEMLMNYYKGWSFYRYVRSSTEEVEGKLLKIE